MSTFRILLNIRFNYLSYNTAEMHLPCDYWLYCWSTIKYQLILIPIALNVYYSSTFIRASIDNSTIGSCKNTNSDILIPLWTVKFSVPTGRWSLGIIYCQCMLFFIQVLCQSPFCKASDNGTNGMISNRFSKRYHVTINHMTDNKKYFDKS